MKVLLFVSVLFVVSSIAAPFEIISDSYLNQANVSIASFVDKFYARSQAVLWDKYPSSGNATGYWTLAEGMATIVDGMKVFPHANYDNVFQALYNKQASAGFSRDWYDDENWMAMACVRAHQLTNNNNYLATAIALFKDISAAWDTTCCGSIKGGVWWDRKHTQKASASNAGPVILAGMLHQLTGEAVYLAFASQVYNFWWTHMVNPSNYQVADHINTDGSITWWKFTYNEGLMVGASLAMYDATKNITFLRNAWNIANFMLTNEVTNSPLGPVLYDGTDSQCTGDCQQFKGPAYRQLVALSAYPPVSGTTLNPDSLKVFLKRCVDSLWSNARTKQDTYATNWAGPAPSGPISQAQMNSAASASLLFTTVH